MRRSIRLVSHAVSGEPMQSVMAPKVTRRPAVRMLMSSPDDNSGSIPAGANTEQPVTTFPSIRAIGAKRRAAGSDFMQLHVGSIDTAWKGRLNQFRDVATRTGHVHLR